VASIMLPRASRLSMQIPVSSCISSTDMGSLLAQLVQLQASGARGGHFRVEQTKSAPIFHVIPTEARDRGGNWSSQGSPLDARISFPAVTRTEHQLLATIDGAVSATAHVRMTSAINNGIVMQIGAAQPYYYNIGADDETAREVLTRMFQATPGRRQSWALMNAVEEGSDSYFLNIMDLPANAGCQSAQPLPPPPRPPYGAKCAACGPPPSPHSP
jgi:hypothetical protein